MPLRSAGRPWRAAPQSCDPLAEDSLGAQLLLTVSEQVGDISPRCRRGADADALSGVLYWIVRTANDPAAYDELLDIAWRLALVFGCAFAADG